MTTLVVLFETLAPVAVIVFALVIIGIATMPNHNDGKRTNGKIRRMG